MTTNYPIAHSDSVFTTLNHYRLNYKISREMVACLNSGKYAGVNRGYWLNLCKRDKRNLRKHCQKLRQQLNK